MKKPNTTPAMRKCPMCPKLLRSLKFILYHLVREHSWPVDHLEAPIATQKRRGRRNRKALTALPPPPPCWMGEEMAVEAYAPPPPPPPPRFDLNLYDEKMAGNYPFKKKIASIKKVALEWNRYICNICGKVFNKHTALGGHKAHHSKIERRNKKKKAAEKEKMLVIHVPEETVEQEQEQEIMPVIHVPDKKPRQRLNNGPCICAGCGKEFKSGKGLGGHKRHCKGRFLWIDLNKLPEEMEYECDLLGPARPGS